MDESLKITSVCDMRDCALDGCLVDDSGGRIIAADIAQELRLLDGEAALVFAYMRRQIAELMSASEEPGDK